MFSVVRQTFRETIRSRWLIMFTVVFFFLALNVPFATLSLLRLLPSDYLPTFINTIISVSFPLIPLLPLPLAATSIVEERETGVLQYVLATPISRGQFLAARLFGLFLATTAIIVLGFGIAAFIALRYSTSFLSIWFVTLSSCVLNLSMLGVAISISIVSKKRATALGAAIFLWFIFTVITDANLLAPILATTGRVNLLLPFILLNPVESSRLLAILYVTPPTPTELARVGPTALAMGYFFGKDAITVLWVTLIAWIVASLDIAFFIFGRQDVS